MTTGTDTARAEQETAAAWRHWAPPLVLYASVLVVLLVVSWQTVVHFEEDARVGAVVFPGSWFFEGWLRWDGGWYWGIADLGYTYTPGMQSSVAFFPGYPLAMRFLGRPIENIPLAGIVITIACGLVSTVLFWRWCRTRLSQPAALTALLLLALYPYGWYLYGATYGDAVFLAASLSAFMLLERDHPILAGLAGAVATATRPVGVAVVIGLTVRALERRGALAGQWRMTLPRRVELRRVRPADAGVLLSIAGLAAYLIYLWQRFGDPFLFSSVQETWGQPATPRTWIKYTFFAELFRGDDRLLAYGLLFQALLTLAFIVAVPFVVRRFGWGYGSYVLVLAVIPLIGSKDFQGLGRYMLAAFPSFAVAGELLAERPVLRRAVLPVSATLLVLGTAGFAHGYYLA